MMRTRAVDLGLAWLLSVLLAASAGAGSDSTGAISGQVTEATSGEPIAAANLEVVALGAGTATDERGKFRLAGLPAGTHALRVSCIGYATIEPRVVVRAGGMETIDLALSRRPIRLEEILVQEERAASAASSQSVRRFDLLVRPRQSPQHLLQIVPGLVVAQHAGGGKAEQLFLRGFDTDHGTDVAIEVDGVPVNMVSHGHGQGYADLHFLIPETVERMEVYKGPYFARFGNLANAGQILFRTRDRLDANEIRVEAGAFHSARYTALYQLPTDAQRRSLYFAGDYTRTDGPFDSPQDLQRLSVSAKGRYPLHDLDLTVAASAFASQWDASGQIPARAVAQDVIGRWQAIDDSEGGNTSRRQLSLELRTATPGLPELVARVWAVDYDYRLYSNFTFYRNDSIFGDAIEQTDGRRVAGIHSRYRSVRAVGPLLAATTLGGGFRSDDVDVTLWQVIERRRYWPLVDARVRERNFFLWAEEELTLSPAVRVVLGLRGDLFTFDVTDRLEASAEGVMPLVEWFKVIRATGKVAHVPLKQPHASGLARESVLSPKAGLVVSPHAAVDLFVNFGMGFHSNDARDVIAGEFVRRQAEVLEERGARPDEVRTILDTLNFDPGHRDVGTLPRSVGAEVGTRARVAGWANLSAAAWWIDLEEEFVYSADAGVNERRGQTRRLGADLELRARLLEWLWADVDVNLSRGRLRDAPHDSDRIPLAPAVTSAGGLTARHRSGWEGSLRYRHVDDRPATEDGSLVAAGHSVLDLALAWQLGRIRLDVAAANLLDATWREAQFATESLIPGREAADARRGSFPPADIHFTPGAPLHLRFGVSYRF